MALANARDVAIILLAVESFVIGVLLIILLLQVRSLVRLLQEEIKPVIASVQDTVGTVRGTTNIVSEYVVAPVARLASILAGVRQGVAAFTARSSKSNEEGSESE